MTDQFTSRKIDAPRLISEMLLTHVLGGARIDLYANAGRIASDMELSTLRGLVRRALQHEPVQYIVGNAWFFGMEFQVNQSTLIPRTCTERLVEQAIAFCNDNVSGQPRIADICTGSGCIAVTLAANVSGASIVATDISNDALTLAGANASNHGVEPQLTFLEGDGITPILGLEQFDIVCSNPPYISDLEMQVLPKHIANWEPKLALSGGSDGMEVASDIILSASKVLKSQGLLLVEVSPSTQEHAMTIALSTPELQDIKILKDAFGDDRFLRAIRSP